MGLVGSSKRLGDLKTPKQNMGAEEETEDRQIGQIKLLNTLRSKHVQNI